MRAVPGEETIWDRIRERAVAAVKRCLLAGRTCGEVGRVNQPGAAKPEVIGRSTGGEAGSFNSLQEDRVVDVAVSGPLQPPIVGIEGKADDARAAGKDRGAGGR